MEKLTFVIVVLFFAFNLNAQEDTVKKQGYTFTLVKEIKTSPVKNQYRSGTCWSFATSSFIESELLRIGKPVLDISEMFVVRKVYEDKAEKYVRMHGEANFSGGGAVNDVIDVIEKYGAITEEAYSGLQYGTEKHVHGEIDQVLKAYIDAVIENPNKELSTAWKAGFNGILDAYLGKVPEKFSFNGKDLTPKEFAAENIPINPNDYAYITSFNHHPFNTRFIVEVPDNWTWKAFYNVPLNDMIEIIDNAINEGYGVSWAADVSEKGFSWKNGIAIVPETEIEELTGSEKLKWETMTKEERQKQLFSFDNPVPEKIITQEIRQKEFDNFKTTDDHGMHIVGIYNDQNGVKYYKVKNSWGSEDHKYEGYLFVSEAYMKFKTISLAVHKDALPKKIKKEYEK